MPLRNLRVPLLAAAVPAGVWSAAWAMNRFDLGAEHLFKVNMAFQIAVAAALVVVIVWFFLASGVGRRRKLGVGLAALAAVGLAVAAARKVEFDGQMRPLFTFRWERTADEQLAAFREAAAPAADAADLTAGPTDSPGYRGPAGDGFTPGVTIPDSYKVVWKHPVGGGHAGIAVAGNGVVTLEQRGPDEAVVSYDRSTGAERWAFAYPARFTTLENLGGGGPRTTPLIIGGDVVALGAVGDLVCVDGRTGQKKWAANVLADAGAVAPQWALSGSPLAVGDLVVVNPGGDQNRAVAAYDRRTGARVWAGGNHPAAYASPLLATLGGVRQVVVFDADGLGGHDITSGAELWRFPWRTDMAMNSAQPVVVGPDRLFVSSEKSQGGAVVAVTKSGSEWAATEIWKSRVLSARFASPVFAGGHLFGLTDGRMVCVDAATGKRVWADGSYGNGQILAGGDRLVVTCENGDVAVVAADPAQHRELGRTRDVFDTRTWNVPALAGGVLFARNHREIAALAAE